MLINCLLIGLVSVLQSAGADIRPLFIEPLRCCPTQGGETFLPFSSFGSQVFLDGGLGLKYILMGCTIQLFRVWHQTQLADKNSQSNV